MGKIGPRLFEPEVPIPEDIREAVERWLAYKRERRQAYKTQGLRALVEKMAEWGAERSLAAVKFSMAANYAGLFEDPKRQRVDRDAPPERYLGGMSEATIARWPFLDRHTRATILENISMLGGQCKI